MGINYLVHLQKYVTWFILSIKAILAGGHDIMFFGSAVSYDQLYVVQQLSPGTSAL